MQSDRLVRGSILALALVLVMGLGCNGTEGDDGGPPPGEGIAGEGNPPVPDMPPTPPGLIVHKNAGESAEADFSTGSEEYLVVPYSVSTTAAAAIDFEIKVTASGGSGDAGVGSKSFKLRRQVLPLVLRNPTLWMEWQRRLAVERWTRGLAEKAANSIMRAPNADLDKTLAACSLSSECAATEVCHEGQCAASVSVKVEAFSTAATTIDAEVKKKGTTAAVLVDAGDTVDAATIDKILDKFETLIYPRDVALFGNPELKSGENTLSSDRNADGIVWLVLTSKVAEKNADGFFVATDFDDSDAKSNKTDILYIDSGVTNLENLYATVAHEFQHLLNFGAKVYKPTVGGGSGALEALWLDEGQAHFAEDACGYGGGNVTALTQEVFTSFDTTSMVALDMADDSVAMRGMAFTFVRYLFEKKGGVSYESDGTITDNGGAKLLADFHTTDKQGADAVQEKYGDFKQAFEGWIGAVSLDGRGVTGATALEFGDLVKDPITGNDIGVIIRGTRKDETGADVTLEGPLENDLTQDTTQDTIPNATGKLFKLTGKSGKVQVTVTTQETDFRFALIKIKSGGGS